MDDDASADTPPTSTPWWRAATIYHVYPRSFCDSDGDGVGDLPGVTSRLASLVDLGVDTVWLSPFYPSPMVDFGYDVSDHLDVDPLFGTLDDALGLIDEAHRLGLRVLLDLVPGHVSDQHPWFRAARSSPDDPHRDWFVWRDPAPDGGPPTNWRSEFGGPAWTLDPASGQYYYHAYLPEQPNLNWHHPGVRAAMFEVVDTWLDRGADGFRIDAFRRLFVDRQFRDEPPNPDYDPSVDSESESLLPIHTSEQPEMFELAADLRRHVDARGDHVLLGEIYLEPEALVRYHGSPDRPGLHLAGNFNLLWTPWTADDLADLIVRYEALLGPHAWPTWVLGNHDRSRIASRIGVAQARVAAMFLLTVRGTPTIYAGDELGLTDVPIAAERVRDPWELREPGRGFGRDPVRTPIPWDGAPGHGFTTGEPWLPFGPDASSVNVAAQRSDATSMWNLHRRLLELRRHDPALRTGSIEAVTASGGVLSYRRRSDDREVIVVLETAGRPAELSADLRGATVLLSTHLDREGPLDSVELRADEGLVLAPGGRPR